RRGGPSSPSGSAPRGRAGPCDGPTGRPTDRPRGVLPGRAAVWVPVPDAVPFPFGPAARGGDRDLDPVFRTVAVERPTSLDPRSPFVLDTHELGRRPGSMRQVQRTVAAPEELGTAVIGVPSGSDLALDLRLESVMEGILVSGSVRARAVGECVRCLEE